MSFSVTRISQSFVAPAAPTPEETLFLSIIDRVAGLRHMVLSLHVFKHGREPAKVIREALAKALVPYYPFAGRFVDDAEHGDVRVACTGEGAWFVEATANCSLEDVRDLDLPLMISKDELLPVPSHEFDPINLPLMIQVTEFTCGGFVVGLISVHTIADGLGTAQFVSAIGDIARGLPKPAVDPVWSREVIPSPPKLAPSAPPLFDSLIELVHTTMDVPESAVNQVKAKYLEHTGQRCSTFDVAIAKLWQSRTRAIGLSHDADVHLGFFANTRHLMQQVLPRGFFGNCFYPVSVTACSGEVAGAELVEVVRMIRDGKARLPAEFERWATGDFKADPYELTFSYNSLFVSDWTRLGFLDVDYGWGKPLHVIPFAYFDFMAVGIIGAPPLPRTGTRIMTQCVGKEQLETFMEEMSSSDGLIN